jgi:hypothetical protein
MVDVMCRNIPLVAVNNSTIEGIPVTRKVKLSQSTVDVMCRNIPLVAVNNSTIEGIPVTR